MKGYCAPRDVRLALAPLSDYDTVETAASLEDSQIDDAITEAEGVIDSYIASRYTIPIITVEEVNPDDPFETLVFEVAPDPVRGLTRNVAAYLAALTFRKHKDLTEDDPIRLRHALTLSILEKILARLVALPTDLFPPVEDVALQGVTVVNLYEGTLFTMSDVGIGIETMYRSPAQYLIPADIWRV